MIAAGNTNGEVTIFQIQKELPSDLVTHEIAASLITSNPIERYTIKDAFRSAITCVEWSKNGMKLFSGDSHGVVVLTVLDFSNHICKSVEVVNEKFGIVQMQFSSPWLLVSTLYRAIVCKQDDSSKWNVSQIGRSDRKVLNDFGAVFTPIDVDSRKPPSVICARPGFRFWLADVDGNVSHTFLLKESVNELQSIYEVPLLNPVHHSKPTNIKDTYFGQCFYYLRKFIVTYCESTVFIVNLDKLRVIAVIKRLRKIQYLTVNGNEIFIVEGGRSVVRISTVPESCGMAGKTQYVPLNNPNLIDPNIEVQEEVIAQADECFELPPIESIRLDIPLACRLGEHNLLKQDKLLLEHSRKLEVFEKINTLDYDESILFRVGTKKKKKTSVHSASSDDGKVDGVVEIGRQAEFFDSHKTNGATEHHTEHEFPQSYPQLETFAEFTTKPCLMQASFCDGINNVQDSIPVNSNSIENGVESVPDEVESVHNDGTKSITDRIESVVQLQEQSLASSMSQFKSPDLNYPIYPIMSQVTNGREMKEVIIADKYHEKTPLKSPVVQISTQATEKSFNDSFKEIPLVSDDDGDGDGDVEDDDDSDTLSSLDAIKQCAKNHTPSNTPPKPIQSKIDSKNVQHFTNLANLPKLWDINIEKYDENQYNTASPTRKNSSGNSTKEGSDSEWVFL